jgi:hypothetical protein
LKKERADLQRNVVANPSTISSSSSFLPSLPSQCSQDALLKIRNLTYDKMTLEMEVSKLQVHVKESIRLGQIVDWYKERHDHITEYLKEECPIPPPPSASNTSSTIGEADE